MVYLICISWENVLFIFIYFFLKNDNIVLGFICFLKLVEINILYMGGINNFIIIVVLLSIILKICWLKFW